MDNGLSATYSYRLRPDRAGGVLRLPSALYLPLRERAEGTLVLSDEEEHRIDIVFGPSVGEASFAFSRDGNSSAP